MESITHQLSCRGRSATWDARFTLKGSAATYAPDRTFDTEHIRLELRLDLAKETLTGRAETRLRAIQPSATEMVFDAVAFRIDGVRWNGKPAVYTYRENRITVTAPQPVPAGQAVTVEIRYRVVKPKMGLFFLKPDRAYPERPTQVWTQGEDEYARYWFPCHDAPHERTTTEVIATVPAGFTAVSNGRLLRTTRGRGGATFHWRQDIPHATYLVTLAVGRFSVLKDSWSGIPITYYCEKGREADTRRAFGKTPLMMAFFSRFTGQKYPYAKYAQVAAADFIYGGMENTSATTQTDAALLDERVAIDYTSDELVAHELAHQWFGDFLTCKDWSHAWLNESFATYFDALFKRHDKGEDEFLYAIRQNSEAYFQEDKDHYRRPIVTKVFKRPSDLFDRHLYEKGSVVLFMLHRLLGESLFQACIARYVRQNGGKVVETHRLIDAIEEVTGRNPRRFFDQWVFGAGHPEFKIRSWWDARRKEIVLRVNQTQATSPEVGVFSVETAFYFETPKGGRRENVKIDSKSHLFRFKLDAEPSLILFDPDHAVLKRVDFPKSEAMWLSQLERDSHLLGRIDAAHALARIASRDAVQALRRALLGNDFWAVRAEVARALGSVKSEDAALILLNSLDVLEHPKVRRAVYAGLAGFKSPRVAAEVARRCLGEPSYFAECEGLRTLGALQYGRASEVFREALARDSWNDVVRSAALDGIAAMKDESSVPLLLSYTRAGRSQRLRMAAIRAATSFGPREDVQRRLLELADDGFLLVRIAAVRALKDLGDERALPTLKRVMAADVDGRLKRLAEESAEKIGKTLEGETAVRP